MGGGPVCSSLVRARKNLAPNGAGGLRRRSGQVLNERYLYTVPTIQGTRTKGQNAGQSGKRPCPELVLTCMALPSEAPKGALEPPSDL